MQAIALKLTLRSSGVMWAVGKGLIAASVLLFGADPLQAQAPDALSGEAALRNKIRELENTLRKLQEENAALRQRLEISGKKVPAGKFPSNGEGEKPAKLLPEGARWISSSGKRHNVACRYYGKGEGHAGKLGEGVACKLCGG